MSFASDKINIAGTQYDRRRKLSEQDKQDIKDYVGVSIHELSKMYGVCRRTIQFIKYPERHKKNIEDRQIRGGSKAYYDREKNKNYMKNHRRYKHKLHKEGKIK